MAGKTVSRGIRLSLDTIRQIEDIAKKSGVSFNETIVQAAELILSPENTMAALNQRVEALEENVFRLVSILEDFFPTLVEAEDKAFRSWSSSRLILAWADLVVESGGMPTKEQWQSNKEAQILKFDEQRATVKAKLSPMVTSED